MQRTQKQTQAPGLRSWTSQVDGSCIDSKKNGLIAGSFRTK